MVFPVDCNRKIHYKRHVHYPDGEKNTLCHFTVKTKALTRNNTELYLHIKGLISKSIYSALEYTRPPFNERNNNLQSVI